MNKGIKKNIAVSMVAGKLALSLQTAQAEGLGKSDGSSAAISNLSLDEVGAPFDILTPPASNGSKNGTLYANLAANKRVDFVVHGVQRQRSALVFLAYSKAAGRADQWEQFPDGNGQLELDVNSLQILAGLEILPTNTLDFPSTPFGSQKRKHESVVLPVDLSDLSDFGVEGESIFFQAITVSTDDQGEFRWDLAQASEVDKFIINRTSDKNEEFENIDTGKSSSNGSKTDDNNDTGGK